MKDINGIKIKEGQTLEYSVYTPLESTDNGIVFFHKRHSGLWVNNAPIRLLLSQGVEYRKLKVVKDVVIKNKCDIDVFYNKIRNKLGTQALLSYETKGVRLHGKEAICQIVKDYISQNKKTCPICKQEMLKQDKNTCIDCWQKYINV